jgi:hypothetical protein
MRRRSLSTGGVDPWYPMLEKDMYMPGSGYTDIQVCGQIGRNQRRSRNAGWEA